MKISHNLLKLSKFKDLGIGEYKYTLIVKNSQNTLSEAYSKSFTVIEDTDNPEVIITPTSCEWINTSQTVNLEFNDNDSGFAKWQYVWSTSQDMPSSGWSAEYTTSKAEVTISNHGIWYLHIKASDVAGNEMYRTVGTYKIDKKNPVISNVKVYGTSDSTNKLEIVATVVFNKALPTIFPAPKKFSKRPMFPKEPFSTLKVNKKERTRY